MRRILFAFAIVALGASACSGDDVTAPANGDEVSPSVVASSPPPTPTTLPPSTTSVAPEETTTSQAAATTTTTAAPTTTEAVGDSVLAFEPVAAGFEQPVFVTAPPGDERLFVVDQPGRIWVISDGEVSPFLDLRSLVTFNNEQGLLGLAFHPDYAANGLFYLDYIDRGGDTVLVEYSVDEIDPNLADPDSAREVLSVGQPAANHNGGMIAFGPDGYLWFGLGDGGGADDRFGNGQDADTLLATLVRIEVGPGVAEPYAIPPDNPYADGADGAPEAWAIGLRNPWRWSFDGNLLFIGDVGQNDFEELNAASVGVAGLNYGWPVMEGRSCFRSETCDQAGLVVPILEYPHSDGCSVTGGYVYRGAELPEVDGHYFYGDYCSGWVRSFVLGDGGGTLQETEWMPAGSFNGLTSFGTDAAGELYLTTQSGTVYKLMRG